MAGVAYRRLVPPQQLTLPALAQFVQQVNYALGEMQQKVAEAQGLAHDSVRLGNHLTMGGKRVTGVGQTQGEDDVPSVRELRAEAMYARDGVHRTYKPIEAHGGIRTVTPAIAPNDLITKGQVEDLIVDTMGGSDSVVSNSEGASTVVTSWNGGVAYPQRNLTLVNGANHNVSVDDGIYWRITGPTAPFSISGFKTVADGRYLILQNATTQDMTLTNDAGSVAANRLLTLTGADLTMNGLGITTFLYSVADVRWVSL